VWLLISRRFRLYLVFALGAPLVAWLLDAVGRRLEARSGPTRVSNTLRWAGGKLRRKARGPLKHTGERPEQPRTSGNTDVTEPGYARSDAAQEIGPRGA
jgi:hypothetical protein